MLHRRASLHCYVHLQIAPMKHEQVSVLMCVIDYVCDVLMLLIML